MVDVYRDGELTYKIIGKESLEAIYKLTEEIYSRISDKDTYIKDAEEEIARMIDRSYGIGVFKNEEMVAFRYISYGSAEDSVAKYLTSLNIEAEEVVFLESVMVREDVRGRNVQNKTREILMDFVKHRGFCVFFSTVSPDNLPSYRNVLKSGFSLVGLADTHARDDKPEGWKRFIFYKNLRKELEFEEEERTIHAKDYEKIEEALEQQFFGVDCNDENIVFRKMKK